MSKKTELQKALGVAIRPIYAVIIFGMVINLLLLVPPLYMLQVYDRVLASGSQATLLMLSIIAAGMLLAMGLLEIARSRVMVRVGSNLDNLTAERTFSILFDNQLRGGAAATGAQPLSDLATVRKFMTGNGLFAFFDAPWVPVFLFILFMLNPLLGWIAVGGACLIVVTAIMSHILTRKKLKDAIGNEIQSSRFAESSLRNAEVVHAMGMVPNLRRKWIDQHSSAVATHASAQDWSGSLTSISKFIRITLQSALLGGGALLAIDGQISPGMMIAGTIIGGKALQPIDTAIASWSQFIGARLAYSRLQDLYRNQSPDKTNITLPAPKGEIIMEQISALPPGASKPTLHGINLTIPAGQWLGVIGPSGAGKSTFARLVTGIWQASSGKVRIDGADITSLPTEALGPYMGYLPQDIELFAGTIAENIARFNEIDSNAVIKASTLSGVHDMILRLPKGYDTEIGPGGSQLSGGQRQRIGLARALYGDPSIIVLDEPNASLDAEGEANLLNAMQLASKEGATVIVISHTPKILEQVDQVLVLRDGQIMVHGPRDEVFAKATKRRQEGIAHQQAARAQVTQQSASPEEASEQAPGEEERNTPQEQQTRDGGPVAEDRRSGNEEIQPPHPETETQDR